MTNANTQNTLDPMFVLYTAFDIDQCIDINIVYEEKRCVLSKNIIFGAKLVTENE